MRFRNQTVGNEMAPDTPRHVFCMSHFVRVTPSMTVSFKSSPYKSSIDEHAENVVANTEWNQQGEAGTFSSESGLGKNTNIQHEEDGIELKFV